MNISVECHSAALQRLRSSPIASFLFSICWLLQTEVEAATPQEVSEQVEKSISGVEKRVESVLEATVKSPELAALDRLSGELVKCLGEVKGNKGVEGQIDTAIAALAKIIKDSGVEGKELADVKAQAGDIENTLNSLKSQNIPALATRLEELDKQTNEWRKIYKLQAALVGPAGAKEKLKAAAETALERWREKMMYAKPSNQTTQNSPPPHEVPTPRSAAAVTKSAIVQTPSRAHPEKSWDRPHIYVYVAKSSQLGVATSLKDQLQVLRYMVPQVASAGSNPDVPAVASELRYFTLSDLAEAQRICAEVKTFFPDLDIVPDFADGMHVSHARQYEIWLSSSLSADNRSTVFATGGSRSVIAEADFAAIKKMVLTQLDADARSDIRAVMSQYSDFVDFLDEGVKSRTAIEYDLPAYYAHWPRRHASLIGDISVKATAENECIVRFSIDFEAENPAKLELRASKVAVVWRVRRQRNDSDFKIVSYKQKSTPHPPGLQAVNQSTP